MSVTVSKESETKTTYAAGTYELRRVTEKTLDRIAAGKADLYEVIAKRVRIQTGLQIPEPRDLADCLAQDLVDLTAAIRQAVDARQNAP